jgi:hypothetical protein
MVYTAVIAIDTCVSTAVPVNQSSHNHEELHVMFRMKESRHCVVLLVMLVVASTSSAVGSEETGQWEPFFEKFTLNQTSLTGGIHIAAPCSVSWKVLTELTSLQKLGPHLHLTTEGGLKSAEKRGDLVHFSVDKPNGITTGTFVLASPVPFYKVQAVVVPDKGPWMRIQEWVMNPEGENKCMVTYNEAYNQLWLKAAGIEGADFIAKDRDHHIHVILRRGKNLAEGKEAGPPEETAYLMDDARNFPERFRTASK